MIGRISMNGKIAQYSTGLGSSSEPTAIVQAPDGSMWFVETATNRLGRVKL
jgi:streptogramin lyase